MAERRAGALLHRSGQPDESHAALRDDRGHQPVRRAAAAALRVVQPREHQSGKPSHPHRGRPVRDRLGIPGAVHPDLRAFPGQCHRHEQVPDPRDREMHQGQPEDRPGRDGVRPHALQAGRPVRLGSRPPDGRAGHEVHLRDRLRRIPACGRAARRVPLLEGLPPRGARPAGTELLRDHRGPNRHDQHDCGYVGRLRAGI